jgi:hypothetical protein
MDGFTFPELHIGTNRWPKINTKKKPQGLVAKPPAAKFSINALHRNTSFPRRKHPLFAAAPNVKSDWETGTFALGGRLSAISWAIRGADLPVSLTPG